MKVRCGPARGCSSFSVDHAVSALRWINEHRRSDADPWGMEHQIAIVSRDRSVCRAGNWFVYKPVPQRSAGLAVGIEGVNAVVLGCDEDNIVRSAGDAQFRNEQRLAVDKGVNRASEKFAEQS